MAGTIARLMTAGVVATVTACTNYGQQEQAGMVIGGALGGLLGAQYDGGHQDARTAAIIVGTLAGAAIGGAVGRSMDQVDRIKTSQTLENVRTGVSSSWRNPDTGNLYSVTPTRTYETAGSPCREYVIKARIGGKPEEVYGTACRQPDGSWKTM
jgi:surface antigen